jgi:hypothetical protein
MIEQLQTGSSNILGSNQAKNCTIRNDKTFVPAVETGRASGGEVSLYAQVRGLPWAALRYKLRGYFSRPVAHQVMKAQARCNMAMKVSGSFSQRRVCAESDSSNCEYVPPPNGVP